MTKRRLRGLTFVVAAMSVFAGARCAEADYIYQSATLGPTGQDGGFYVEATANQTQWLGVRFQVTSTVTSAAIGGDFVVPSYETPGTIFGAVVQLSGPDGFPDSFNLSTPDVLGHALLTPPALSDLVSAPLTVTLTPGWYALLYGSGEFGATAVGFAPGTDTDISTPSYFQLEGSASQPQAKNGPSGPQTYRYEDTGSLENDFFLTAAAATPEPTSLTLFVLGATCLAVGPLRLRWKLGPARDRSVG